jgi:hypothetical protein
MQDSAGAVVDANAALGMLVVARKQMLDLETCSLIPSPFGYLSFSGREWWMCSAGAV